MASFHRTRFLSLWLTGLLVTAACLQSTFVRAQCDPTVPTFTVDLTSSPTATYLSPPVQRLDHCCGVTNPDQCVQFIVTLHPLAQGILFDICSGATPGGAMFYQVGCGPIAGVGTELCLNGPGPHVITFCKPGNNVNEYCITSIPGPSVGPAIVVNEGCTGMLGSSGYDATTVNWTSIAPGVQGQYNNYLACTTCPNTLVTAFAGYPPFVDYVICGTGVAPCNAVTVCDTVRVIFNSTLTASIVPTQPTVCFGAAGTTITAVGGGGTPPYSYLWSTGGTTASIFVGPGTYSVQVSDTSNCPPTSANVTVTQFMQPIQALAGSDIVVCGSAYPIQLNGTVTGASGGQWSGGGGAYQPSSASPSASYWPTPAEVASGSLQLTLTTTGNGTCPGDQDVVLITFNDPFPVASISGTNVSCNGAGNGTASFLPNDPSFTYLWNDPLSQTTATAVGLQAGTYTVQVTDGLGCDTSLSVVITEPLAVSIANVQVINETCAGFGNGSVSVTASGGTAPYQYTWSNGATTSTITVGAGNYTVWVTDANGCVPATATATVTSTAQPNVANGGADQIICLGSYPIALQGSVVNATSGNWSGGVGTFIGSGLNVGYTPTSAEVINGGVSLFLTTVGNTNCPADVDTVYITLSNVLMYASISSTDVSCANGLNGTATALPAMGVTYQWNDPLSQTTSTAVGLAPGPYNVTITDQYQCSTMLSAIIGEPPPFVISSAQGTNPTCSNSTNGMATVNVTGGTPGYQYQWSANTGNQITQTAQALGSGTFIVVVTDDNGCTTQGTVMLTVPAPIQVITSIPDTVCVNALVQLTAQASGGVGNYTINWMGIGQGSPLTYSFPTSQVIAVSVVDGNGCQSPMVSTFVNVLDLSLGTLAAFGDTIVCPGEMATVSAAVNNYPGAVVFTWPSLGLTGPGPFSAPANGQVLTVVATDVCGNTLTDGVLLLTDTPPVIVLPDVIAEGCDPMVVSMPSGLTTVPVSYQWDLGNGQTSTQPAPTAIYGVGSYVVSLVVTTANGCSASAVNTGQVIVHPHPTAAFSADPWVTTFDNALVNFTNNSTPINGSFTWDFGDSTTSNTTSPDHTYHGIGYFPVQLVVENEFGCTDTAVHTIQITPVYDIEIPNAFTPDPIGGNGGVYDPTGFTNDVFFPFVRFVKSFEMRIWNRWGELVFESTDIMKGWDGYYHGKLSQQDVYIYRVQVRFVDDHTAERIGDLTLFR